MKHFEKNYSTEVENKYACLTWEAPRKFPAEQKTDQQAVQRAKFWRARSRLYRSRFCKKTLVWKLLTRDLQDLQTFAPLRPKNSANLNAFIFQFQNTTSTSKFESFFNKCFHVIVLITSDDFFTVISRMLNIIQDVQEMENNMEICRFCCQLQRKWYSK